MEHYIATQIKFLYDTYRSNPNSFQRKIVGGSTFTGNIDRKTGKLQLSCSKLKQILHAMDQYVLLYQSWKTNLNLSYVPSWTIDLYRCLYLHTLPELGQVIDTLLPSSWTFNIDFAYSWCQQPLYLQERERELMFDTADDDFYYNRGYLYPVIYKCSAPIHSSVNVGPLFLANPFNPDDPHQINKEQSEVFLPQSELTVIDITRSERHVLITVSIEYLQYDADMLIHVCT